MDGFGGFMSFKLWLAVVHIDLYFISIQSTALCYAGITAELIFPKTDAIKSKIKSRTWLSRQQQQTFIGPHKQGRS